MLLIGHPTAKARRRRCGYTAQPSMLRPRPASGCLPKGIYRSSLQSLPHRLKSNTQSVADYALAREPLLNNPLLAKAAAFLSSGTRGPTNRPLNQCLKEVRHQSIVNFLKTRYRDEALNGPVRFSVHVRALAPRAAFEPHYKIRMEVAQMHKTRQPVRANMGRLAFGAIAGAAMLCGLGTANAGEFHGAAATKAHYGAIFQIDAGGNKAIKKTLNNIENLLHDKRLEGKVTVELIANSRGFDVYVKGNGFEKKLRHLQKEGVILAQCANTLRELHIDRHDLYPFIHVVPSGVGEITIREAEGWAYIHPSAPNPNRL